MFVSQTLVECAELRRREFVAQGEREHGFNAALAAAPVKSPFAASPQSAEAARGNAVLIAARYARFLLTSLATVAFGISTN
jgi:hypothetical protein